MNHLQDGLQRKLLSADVDVVPPLDRGVQSHFHALDIRVEGRDGGVHDVDPGLRQNDVRKTGSDVDDAPVDVRRGFAVHVDAVKVVGAPQDAQQSFKHVRVLVELEAEGQGELFFLSCHRPAIEGVLHPRGLAVLRHTSVVVLSARQEGAVGDVLERVQLRLVSYFLAA